MSVEGLVGEDTEGMLMGEGQASKLTLSSSHLTSG